MLITLKDIYKIVGGRVLFECLNFELNEGQRVGLVGRNGSGKSTLFRLITKEESIDGGDVFIRKHLTIGYLKQIPEEWESSGRAYLEAAFGELLQMKNDMQKLEEKMLDPEQMERSLREYGEIQERFTQAGGYEIESSISQVANGLKVKDLLDQPFSQLSGGEKTKLGLARILLEKPDVLLLDEPTNHLDLQAIEWLEEYLQQYDGSVCMISHDRSFLNHTVTDIMDLESGDIQTYKGNYTSFEKQKEEKLLAEFHQYQEQQKKIKKMKEAIRRLRQWANEANPTNPKLFKKAKSMEKALERMEKMDKPVVDPKKMNLALQAEGRTGKDILVAEGVKKTYGARTILNGVHLHLRNQDRLALVGANGSGKSTLLRLLLGQEEPEEGSIKTGPSIRIGYLPQNPLMGADRDQRMIDYFRNSIRVTEGEARHMLAAFMFYGYDVFQKIRHLSGGEQMRLKLAVFMHKGINVLILDEPTNHLDIESQEVLEEALKKFEGTVLGVSHDRYFLNQCFSDTAYLSGGKIYRYIGSYDETRKHWMELLAQQQMKYVRKESSSKAEKPRNHPPDTKQNFSVEESIADLEKEVTRLESQMAEESNVEELMNLQVEKDQLNEKIEELYEQWMEE
ncbi:ABC transporter ATP-binding protein [Halobacillus halophilus]|uniref:ABC-type transport system ATP-binding protein n=1 Tax=Halobacillus halophilus (strain ATCC 35676 / DSM 2266 / JCM 20832 / KCTC 3685 / LMG 17431 / NBRC 102448 / NCIMB 2269) TaxID=866895 RepID=I0JHY4_HALH3|nr:ABC-F type ribosomal protection protein [Halobacillus halophilus]ASF37953.1 ABC transporter ATP-binding protein [Halobacillus halophilus]CCG43752.1 ABC-type transport system ATP-binding protein [Halobacillus halophilus DSM 2266]